jgi:hypothetical protein
MSNRTALVEFRTALRSGKSENDMLGELLRADVGVSPAFCGHALSRAIRSMRVGK